MIVKLGSTYPYLKNLFGDFDDWIILRSGGQRSDFKIVNPVNGEALPHPTNFAGIILTGSHAMVTDQEKWSKRVADWLLIVVKNKIPVLGICYGHQLLAQALGGCVDYNPNGMEFGTVELRLTHSAMKNPLFRGVPSAFSVHVSHSQSVIKLPPRTELLASSEKEPHQAFFLPPSSWGVQFHPEFNDQISGEYVRKFTDQLKKEGQNVDSILDNIQETPESENILKNFMKMIS